MEITDDIVKEFKLSRNIYYSHKDKDIKRLMKNSYIFLSRKCGEFPMDEENEGKELVFNRTRYDMNDALEYFDENFMSMVMNFSNRNLKELTPDEDSDEQTLSEA